MVVQTIRLADQPNLFKHRRGAKVVQRAPEGYADPESAGVVVDGTWRGDPSGGAYTVSYQVKRDQGGYFDADETTLLKRLDTDVELRDEIREKIISDLIVLALLFQRRRITSDLTVGTIR